MVFVAIFPHSSFFGVYAAVNDEAVVAAHVFEYNFAVS
jgi:hypothetical protein